MNGVWMVEEVVLEEVEVEVVVLVICGQQVVLARRGAIFGVQMCKQRSLRNGTQMPLSS